jgi:hypothetical protein
MSSLLTIPIPPVKLARKAWLRLFGLLLLALTAAVALAFYGYQLYKLKNALSTYQSAAAQFHVRTEAIHRLSSMEAAFNRYLLDGNSANVGLMQSDQRRIEQLAQQDAGAQHDQLLQNIVAVEQKWSGQTVQLMIEERRKLAAGQGLPEDFLNKYRSANQDLQTINFEIAADNDQRQAQQALQQAEDQLRWTWLPIPLAGLLAIGIVWLTIHATKGVHHLKQAAENEGEEEEDDDGEEPHEQGEKAK